MEKCKAFNVPLYMCLIDYAKAFDCVNQNQLWQVMRQIGFPFYIIGLICSLYKEQESAVRTGYGDTNWFRVEGEVAVFSAKRWDHRNRADLIESATPCHDAQVVGSYRARTHST